MLCWLLALIRSDADPLGADDKGKLGLVIVAESSSGVFDGFGFESEISSVA